MLVVPTLADLNYANGSRRTCLAHLSRMSINDLILRSGDHDCLSIPYALNSDLQVEDGYTV